MSINTTDLQNERDVLVKDFEALKDRIKQVDAELIQMKSNLNAVHGAIQQVDKLIKMSEETTKMPDEKEKALNLATS
jgi:septal ring factor EnvC (AmiA/AmiB activator)|tara:strand:+ start:1608 stop:1838 length:231 start_codon:yes stop_codon:yes gene_type:complete